MFHTTCTAAASAGASADTTTSSTTNTTTTTSVSGVPTTTLSNGITIPLVGLGCASGVRKREVLAALKSGYRYLDTAQSYQWGYHEADVAAAIVESPYVERKDVFVTTKVHPENLGYDAMKRAIQSSLHLEGFEGYLDAVLIHKPRCWQGACTKQPEGTWQESWKAMEEYYDAGLIKSIGICDVNDDGLLQELLQQRIKPHIIQNWFDPFHQETTIRQKIQEAGILYQGYSTLGAQWSHFRGLKENPVHTSPLLNQIAQRHSDTASNIILGPAQVVIQWATRKNNISVIPASRNPQRQQQNLVASFQFELTPEELKLLDDMDGKAPRPTRPDPNDVSITFMNPASHAIAVFWIGNEEGEETSLGSIEAGQSKRLNSHHGHSFVFRDETNQEIMRHTISRHHGPQQEVLLSADEDEL